MVQKQSESRPWPRLRVTHHGEIAVGIAERQKWSTANMQTDVQRLHFPIAKAVELRQLHERNPVVSQIVARLHAGTDHLLAWDAVSFLRDRAHEVHAACRHDIGLKAVLP